MAAQSATLYEEQLKTQHLSNKFRTLEDYDARLEAVGSSFRIRDFLRRRSAAGPVRWVDVPSGLGVALHEACEEFGPGVQAVGIDLIRWDETTLTASDLEELRGRLGPARLARILSRDSFRFIQQDMAKAVIPGGADLITSVAGIYYHEDPLAVWQNLYNQLRPGGVLAAHFMFPKRGHAMETHRRLAAALESRAKTELCFSRDGRDVVESTLVTRKLVMSPIRLASRVVSVRPYTVSWGRGGKFQIKAVEYRLAEKPVS
ncbi:MAG TPA: hypothetical protein VL404_00830 [Candidatus Eisenbacteria bacterium]|nr:hypothetical protein [Candidatus Eisenbacteria bacterium]